MKRKQGAHKGLSFPFFITCSHLSLCYYTGMKRVCIIIMCLTVILAMPCQASADKFMLTITFTGASVIGGVYIVLHWIIAGSSEWQPFPAVSPALFYRDSDGWQVGCPRINLIEHGDSEYASYLNIIKIQF